MDLRTIAQLLLAMGLFALAGYMMGHCAFNPMVHPDRNPPIPTPTYSPTHLA